ncbi:type II toxin-antitoxin system antitoxin DNA ADP-ribosyl glycohydrolase DarG [Streptomyces zagrosensis]|uniref:O-acetyl-ADP-ribose deacetylase (Regulator of RNase III) n=1 Tax=Streptomyces zagrosensis TaxID=1042984 RepID=A0A7W9QDU2_9ACTN|nr:macro domain-containing protein [Streptomyces zagrosensis]MBB5938209.1 O-acetyl-ADP-ribose deacetylase (regulator of RNase III) [Streptomyces zagrosensis]
METVIQESQGNLLEADVEAIVNTVNTVGVMGKGIALQIKQAFPENFKQYKAACDRGEVKIGEVFVHDAHHLGPRRYILNFPTKRHWRGKSRIEDVEAGLNGLVEVVRRHKIKSVAVPALGCGNGGLSWDDVRPMIYSAFEALPTTEVLLFPPTGAPAPSSMPVRTSAPNMTRGRAAVVALLGGYVEQAKSERVEASDGASLLELQKLMYLLQAVGMPMRLNFEKARYGPYAENLNHQLQRMEGHLVRGYGDRTQRVLDFHPIKLTAEAKDLTALWFEQNRDAELENAVHAVLELIDGFSSPYGLELLCTTHWIMHQLGPQASQDDVIAALQKWSRRKAEIFTDRHIAVAWQRLQTKHLAALPA